MMQFKTVEDYIEFIAGYRRAEEILSTPKRTTMFFLPAPKSPISLARYDVKFVNDVAQQSLLSQAALSDKQYDLAVKIVRKYERQLRKFNIAIPNELPPRLPLRQVNREKRAYIEDDAIWLRFPFNEKLIEQVRAHRKSADGSVEFITDKKMWRLGLVESNVVWTVVWASLNGFEVDSKLTALNTAIQEVEQQPYAIELDIVDNAPVIHNAANSMLNWIAEQGIDFTLANFERLVDLSSQLGFTVSNRSRQHLARSVPLDQIDLYCETLHHVVPGRDSLKPVFDYARRTGKQVWVVEQHGVYPTQNAFEAELLQAELRAFHSDEIYQIHNPGQVGEILALEREIPCLWFRESTGFRSFLNMKKTADKNVVLISTKGLVLEPDQALWLHHAGKIVYYCATTQNKIRSHANSKTINQR